MRNAVDIMCDLFEETALFIAEKNGFVYNSAEATNCRLFHNKVRHLPKSNVSHFFSGLELYEKSTVERTWF